MLHTWGSALTHHPHLHCIVPGGGLSDDGERWVSCRPGFFLPVRVLSRLFRRLFLEQLVAMHDQLKFDGQFAPLANRLAFDNYLKPTRQTEWVVYAKRPFAGPEAVLSYLSLYTHRIAISNQRLIDYTDNTVTFKWKDYRRKGRERYTTMQLHVDEFLRRFLMHVLPPGFHRIRHFGWLANHQRQRRLQQVREQLNVPTKMDEPCPADERTNAPTFACRECGVAMIILQVLDRPARARAPPVC